MKSRKGWGIWVVLLGLLGGLASYALPVAAAPYSVRKISGDTYASSPMLNDSGWVVYTGGSSDAEIYLYKEIGSRTDISNSSYQDIVPQINSSGSVVWMGDSASGYEIYLYNGSGSPVNISNSSYRDEEPQINDSGWVVWSGYDGSDYEIYLYKGSGSPVNISNNSSLDEDPQINDSGWVVWSGGDGIYVYKGSGDPIKISTTSTFNEHPQINTSGRVVWRGYDGSDYEIYLYKGSGDPINISNNTYDDTNPQLNASGSAVWSGRPGGNYEIFLYGGSGSPVNISNNNSYHDDYPQINDYGQVVWYGRDYNLTDFQIYVYKGSGDPIHVSSGQYPEINNSGWIVFRNGGAVYLATPTGASESISMYRFSYYFNNGSGDYYTGLVFAPTSFQTAPGLMLQVGTCLYEQPLELWDSGYRSLNGGYYYITQVLDGYAANVDHLCNIVSYYDADTAKTTLLVNSDGSSTSSMLSVTDRTQAYEQGYAISGSNHAAFSPYTEADVAAAAGMAPGASLQAVWAAYWSQSASVLEEEK